MTNGNQFLAQDHGFRSTTLRRHTAAFSDFMSIHIESGEPRRGTIEIEYFSNTLITEDALERLIRSFQKEPISSEALVNRMLDQIIKSCITKHARVSGSWASSDGMRLTVQASHPGNGGIRAA